jgi:hypothetical protein
MKQLKSMPNLLTRVLNLDNERGSIFRIYLALNLRLAIYGIAYFSYAHAQSSFNSSTSKSGIF